MHTQQVSSVGTGSEEKKIFDEPLGGQHEKVSDQQLCEDRMEHESKKLQLVGGSFVLSYEMGCVYLDVDVSDEMTATTTLGSVAKTLKRYPDPDNDKTEANSMQQWKANLMPDKIVYDMVPGMFMDPLQAEKGRLRADLGEQAQDS